MNQEARRTIPFPTFMRTVLSSAAFALGLSSGAYAQTPSISLGDVSLSEGDAGTVLLDVPVTRAGDVTENIGLVYQTGSSSTNPATAGTDYVAVAAGNAVLPAGQTSLDLPITINGDTTAENDEEFLVQLISAINAGPTPNYAAASSFPAGDGPFSVALGDFNGDGKPDLAVSLFGGYSVAVLLNTTSPGATTATFAAAIGFNVGSPAIHLTVADLNGDGRPDLAVANSGNTVSVLLNTTAPGATTASFTAYSFFAADDGPRSVAAGDINGDGRPDLAVANLSSENVSVLLNTTAPGSLVASFASAANFGVGSVTSSVVMGDINGDGRLDLAASNFGDGNVSVLFNTTVPGAGAASFAVAGNFGVGSGPRNISAGDINGDGRPDLATANGDSDNVSVLLNTTAPGASSASFAAANNFDTGSNPYAVAVGDLNGDGRADLAVANYYDDSASVLLNTSAPGAAAASFAPATSFAAGVLPRFVTMGDLNGDGLLDLALANLNSSNVSVFLSTTAPAAPAASFAAADTFAVASSINPFAVGDLNGDGRPDLVVPNEDGDEAVLVLLNATSPDAPTAAFGPTSSFAVSNEPYAVALGDLNGDGRPDLAVTIPSDDSISVLLNTTAAGSATASFASPVQIPLGAGFYPLDITIADFNGDGRPDLATANNGTNNASVLLNTSAPGATVASFAAASTFAAGGTPYDVETEDFNGDGRPDFIVVNYNGNSVSVLLNTTTPGASTASFVASNIAVGNGPLSVAVGDLNGDGRPDLATANTNDDSVSVLFNTSAPGATTASFALASTLAAGESPGFVAMRDLNGDGKTDLAIAIGGDDEGAGGGISVRLNTTAPGATAASFSAASAFAAGEYPQAVAVADFNGDGKPDVAAASPYNGTLSILMNQLYAVSIANDESTATILDDDAVPPYVVSINRVDANPTTAASVSFTVTFSKAVTGVDTGDFALTTTGVAGATVSAVTGSGVTRTVSVDTGDGSNSGTIRLDLVDNNSILATDFNQPLGDSSGGANGNFTTGQGYDYQTQFALSASTAGTGTGTVTSAPAGINCTMAPTDCNATFTDGATVTLTATPDASSDFTGWSGACTGTAACSVVMSEARNITATFTLKQRDLTVTLAGTGSGTVSSAPAGIDCGSNCAESYTDGTIVTLTATPATDANFTGWTGACSGTGACSVTMDAAKNVEATFTLKTFNLTVTRGGTGVGSVTSTPAGINCGSTCAAGYSIGTSVALTATAGSNSVFAGWSGACSGTGSCVVPMSANSSVQAIFTANLPAVSFAAASESVLENAGSITLTVQLNRASAQTVTVPVSVTGGSAGSGDFSVAVSSVSFPPNQTSATFIVAISDDALSEGNETVVLTLGNPTNAVLASPVSNTLTILDNDASLPVNNSPTATADSLIVDEDSGPSAIDVLANDADADGDALVIESVSQPEHGTARILRNPLRITYTPNPDFNGNDSFSYRVADGRGGAASARVNVTVRPVDDTGAAEFFTADVSIAENAGQGEITVIRGNGAEGELRVRVRTTDGTATAGEDYEAVDEVLVFANGESGPLSVRLEIFEDDIYEGDETFNVTLEPMVAAGAIAAKALSSATATIVDDDPVPLPIVEVRGEGGGSWSLLSGLVMLLGVLLRGRRTLPFSAVLAAILPGVAAAQSSPQPDSRADWYVGAGIGIAHSGSSGAISSRLESAGYSMVRVDLDDSDTSFSLYGGRNLWRSLALELGYDDLGTYSVDIAGAAADPAALAAAVMRDLPVGGEALAVRLRWQQPLPANFGVNVVAGPYYWRSERTVRTADLHLRSKDDGAGIQLGGGFSYAVTPRLQLLIDGLYNKPEGELSVRRFGLGAQWNW